MTDVYVTGVFLDQSFNLYNSDSLNSPVVLKNSTGSGGENNVFLAKYDSLGNVKWGAPMGGPTSAINGGNVGNGVTVDANSNVYVTGQFQGTTFNLYNANGTQSNIVITYSTGLADSINVFLAKYDSFGNALWAAPMGRLSGGNSGGNYGLGVTVDTNSNVYVTGKFYGELFNLFNGDSSPSNIIVNGSANRNNVFLAKYNSDGFAQWGTRMEGFTNIDKQGYGVTVDTDGNVYVTGAFTDTNFYLYNIDGTSTVVISTTATAPTKYYVFLAKYNSAGFAQWGVKMQGTFLVVNKGFGVTVDANNNVYVTGQFQNKNFYLYNRNGTQGILLKNSTGNDNNSNAFLAKYNSDGFAQWGAPMGGSTSENDYGLGVTVDTYGNVYVTGSFSDRFFNLYNGDSTLSSVVLKNSTGLGGHNNVFLAKYNSNGKAQWGAPMGSLSLVAADQGKSVTVDVFDYVYVTGAFNDPSFNLYNGDSSLSSIVLNKTSGDFNGFIAKYDSNGNAVWGARMGGISSTCSATSIAVNRFYKIPTQWASAAQPLSLQKAMTIFFNSM